MTAETTHVPVSAISLADAAPQFPDAHCNGMTRDQILAYIQEASENRRIADLRGLAYIQEASENRCIADLRGADLTGANLTGADITLATKGKRP
jgi:uncharacterized protein YjbI with pentapeptide repeats